MLFDLFPIAKVSIKIEYPNKFLLFIENLCFCSLKIAVCVPKIAIGRKSLKITIESKNYYLKIPVRLKISVRSENPYLKISVRWANSPERCKCSGVLQRIAPDESSTEHTTTTRPPEESRRATKGDQEQPGEQHQRRAGRKATNKINFALYIGTIADDEKKYKKS